jgi:4-hydroxybenzoyl-CoA thioesterase
MTIFARDVPVSFGDCDPAGIVYYPNFFRWMDGTFHAFLTERAGGHATLCRALGARGLGLMDTQLAFRSPATEGMSLRYEITAIDWSSRSYRVGYRATAGDRVVLDGHELRGVFVERDGRLAAGGTEALRTALGL